MELRRSHLLLEATQKGDLIIDLTRNITGSFDLPKDDHVKQLEKWRKQCKDYYKVWHGSYCPRCDEPWRAKLGGAKWAQKTDWVPQYQGRGPADPAFIAPRGEPKAAHSPQKISESCSTLKILSNFGHNVTKEVS